MKGTRDKLLNAHADALELCTYCPKLCRHVCPVAQATGNESLTPQAKMELLNLLRNDAVPTQPDYLAPAYGCTTCRLCLEVCRHDVAVAEALLDGRAHAVRTGVDHTLLGRLPERFRARNERLRAELLKQLPPEVFAEEAQVGYLPGCDAIEHSPEDIHDALAVFAHLGLGFIKVVDAPQVCPGYPLWAAGHVDSARFVAEELQEHLRRFATVVCGCPACVYLLRQRLPAEGIAIQTEVMHLSEYLFLHAERLAVRRKRPAALYHDPCYLGRYLDVYQPPRRLLERCVESPREFFHSRERADCCGAGGLVPNTFPEASTSAAKRRLAEAELYGVDLVVTACPACKHNLRAAQRPVEVLDLVNLLAWSLDVEHGR